MYPDSTLSSLQMLQLMRSCKMELDDETTLTLMRFLLYTNFHGEHCVELVKRVHRTPALRLSHQECVAMSFAVNRHIHPARRVLSVTKSNHDNPNYLNVFPLNIHRVSIVLCLVCRCEEK